LDHPLHKEVKNEDGKTPWQVFKEEHKALRWYLICEYVGEVIDRAKAYQNGEGGEMWLDS
jgi:hypothetical protein